MSVAGAWPDAVDDVLAGDQAVMLAYATPAGGVVLTPVTNFGLRDRERGTITVNSSVSMWKKLDRIARNGRIALAFHTREHGFGRRAEYVLLQGAATLSQPDPRYAESLGESWVRFAGRPETGLWRRWLRVYHCRVGIELAVERTVVWRGLSCEGEPETHGAPLPAALPAAQRPPTRGSGPRIDHRRAARRAARLPHVLIGWVAADGYPMVVPAHIGAAEQSGIRVHPPDGLLPPGGRRAGLTAHSFGRHVIAQTQRVHTGWLEADGEGGALYAPHTEAGHRLPPSKLVYRLAVGYETRRRLRSRPTARSAQ